MLSLKNWIAGWKKNGWKTSKKDPVENQDLWKLLLHYTHIHNVTWVKVAGHSDDELNNRCDKLATDQIKNSRRRNSAFLIRVKLYRHNYS